MVTNILPPFYGSQCTMSKTAKIHTINTIIVYTEKLSLRKHDFKLCGIGKGKHINTVHTTHAYC